MVLPSCASFHPGSEGGEYGGKDALLVQLRECPSAEDIDEIWSAIVRWVKEERRRDDRCSLVFKHVDAGEFEPLSPERLLHLVAKMVHDRSLLAERFGAVVVQPKVKDEKVRAAEATFKTLLSMYGGDLTFDVKCRDEDVKRVLEGGGAPKRSRK